VSERYWPLTYASIRQDCTESSVEVVQCSTALIHADRNAMGSSRDVKSRLVIACREEMVCQLKSYRRAA
jgi:hypothetical protein